MIAIQGDTCLYRKLTDALVKDKKPVRVGSLWKTWWKEMTTKFSPLKERESDEYSLMVA